MFDSFSYPQYLVWEWFTLTSTRLHRPAAIIYFFIAWSETQLRYRNSLPWPAFKPSVPSRRRISGLAEFWPAAENPPKKMRPPKTPLNFRKLVSRRKNPAKFGWVGLYRKCISWLSFTCPHLLLQSMLNACSVGLVANGSGQTYQQRQFIVFVSCMAIRSCFSDCDITDCIITRPTNNVCNS